MTESREAACWLALLNARQVKRQLAKRVIHGWCVMGGQPLEALFELGAAEAAERTGLSQAEAAQVLAAGPDVAAQQAVLARLAGRGVGVITRVDAAYPDLLAERLPEERLPYTLYCEGDVSNLAEPGVAVLGSAAPAPDAQALVGAMATALAGEGRLLVGGYDRGVDRLSLDGGRDAGAALTVMLPGGIDAVGALAQRLMPRGRADRVLMLSPFAPTTTASDALAASRLCLVGALAEVLVLVAPDGGPDELCDLRDLFASSATPASRRALVWTGDRGGGTQAWIDASAQPFDGIEAGLAHVLARLGAPAIGARQGAGVDDLAGVEPIVFHDADAAIEALGQSGRVPDALARRLREAKWDEEWYDD